MKMPDTLSASLLYPPWQAILFYDAQCPFCQACVYWFAQHDDHYALRFAPLQGETFHALSLPSSETNGGCDSVLLFNRLGYYAYADALFLGLSYLGGGWNMLAKVGSWLPPRCTKWCYQLVAKHRFRMARFIVKDRRAIEMWFTGMAGNARFLP